MCLNNTHVEEVQQPLASQQRSKFPVRCAMSHAGTCRGVRYYHQGYEVRHAKTFIDVAPVLPLHARRRSVSCPPVPPATPELAEEAPAEVMRAIVDAQLGLAPPASGVTLMWHVPTNLPVDPDLLLLLDRLGAAEVQYVYVPMVNWDVGSQLKYKAPRGMFRAVRNKGYAFVEFATAEAAEAFAESLSANPGLGKAERMHTTLAKYQGAHANIRALLAMPDRRRQTQNVCFFLRHAETLYRVGMGSLRQSMRERGA